MDLQILRFDELPSTNTEALSQARKGAAEGLCIVAKSQTAGRGRVGRAWKSESGEGLYLSVVLRPKFESLYFPVITLATAVAVAETLESEFGLVADIKWPNDVLVGNRKISGILAETAESAQGTAVVVGVGLNTGAASVAGDLRDTATSLETEIGSRPVPESALNPLLRFLFFHYNKMADSAGRNAVLERWAERSSYYSGKPVRVTLSDRVVEGVTAGLDDGGALIVRTSDGSEAVVLAGDVTSLRA